MLLNMILKEIIAVVVIVLLYFCQMEDATLVFKKLENNNYFFQQTPHVWWMKKRESAHEASMHHTPPAILAHVTEQTNEYASFFAPTTTTENFSSEDGITGTNQETCTTPERKQECQNHNHDHITEETLLQYDGDKIKLTAGSKRKSERSIQSFFGKIFGTKATIASTREEIFHKTLDIQQKPKPTFPSDSEVKAEVIGQEELENTTAIPENTSKENVGGHSRRKRNRHRTIWLEERALLQPKRRRHNGYIFKHRE